MRRAQAQRLPPLKAQAPRPAARAQARISRQRTLRPCSGSHQHHTPRMPCPSLQCRPNRSTFSRPLARTPPLCSPNRPHRGDQALARARTVWTWRRRSQVGTRMVCQGNHIFMLSRCRLRMSAVQSILRDKRCSTAAASRTLRQFDALFSVVGQTFILSLLYVASVSSCSPNLCIKPVYP